MGDHKDTVKTTKPPDLAARYGVFTAAEARALGIRTRHGSRLDAHRMIGSVYSVLPAPWTAEARWTAGALAGGPGALLFGDTLLEILGLEPVSPTRLVSVLLPAGSRRADTGWLHFSRARNPLAAGRGVRDRLDRPLARDIGIASPVILLAHLAAANYEREEVRAKLATMIQKRLITVEEVTKWAAAHPKVPGARVAGWAAAELTGGMQSEGEVRLHKVATALNMPPDNAQVDIWRAEKLVSVTDAFWEVGVAGYFDGAVHMQHKVHQADIALRERLRTAGLVVCEATSATLNDARSFRRTLAARLEQARNGAAARKWQRSERGIDLDPGF